MSIGVLAGPDERLPEGVPAGKPAKEHGLAAPAPAVPELAIPEPAASDPIGVRMNDHGIIEVTLPPDQVIEGRQACAARSAVRLLARGRRLPVMLVISGVLGVSVEARGVYVNSEEPSAFALVGESPVDRVIAHYLLCRTTDAVPARFFTSEPEAISWLRQHARED